MGDKRQKKGLSINLADHKDPQQFLEEMRRRFPDSNISLELEGTSLLFRASERLPAQIIVDAFSVLVDQAKYAMYGPGAR